MSQQSFTKTPLTSYTQPRPFPAKRPALPLIYHNRSSGRYKPIATALEGKSLTAQTNFRASNEEMPAGKARPRPEAPKLQNPLAATTPTIEILDVASKPANKSTASDPLGLQTDKQVAEWGRFTWETGEKKKRTRPVLETKKTGRVTCEGNQFSNGRPYRCEKAPVKAKRSAAFKSAMKMTRVRAS